MKIDTVIITGGANGVGKALVENCLANNMTVITCDIDERGLENLKSTHPEDSLVVFTCDISRHDACDEFMDWVLASYPEVRGLVNNAGLYLGQPIWDYDDPTIDRVMDVNIKGPIWLSIRFAMHLVSQKARGAIVNIASVAGEVGSSDAIYGTAKAGVIGLTKSFAMNFAPHIRVNVVCPGLITNTLIADQIPEYRYKEYQRQELLDEAIIPKNVADVCLFLLSDQAKTLTGTLVRADNGCYPR